MTLFNYILDNNVIFYSIFTTTVGFIGYSCISSYYNSYYIDEGVQTEAWEDYSNGPSQIASDSVTTLEAITPVSSTFESVPSAPVTQAISENASTVTTILPIPPVNIEIVPNLDITKYSSDLSVYRNKIHEINELYGTEILDNVITKADLDYIIKSFSVTELQSSDINSLILEIINCFNG